MWWVVSMRETVFRGGFTNCSVFWWNVYDCYTIHYRNTPVSEVIFHIRRLCYALQIERY